MFDSSSFKLQSADETFPFLAFPWKLSIFISVRVRSAPRHVVRFHTQISLLKREFKRWIQFNNAKSRDGQFDGRFDFLKNFRECKFIDSRLNDNGSARKKFQKFADVKMAFGPDATSSNIYDGLIDKNANNKSEIIIFD